MIENFNIRDNNQNLLYSHYSIHANTLCKVANSFNLELSTSINQVPTQYADNPQDSNSIIDLMFLQANIEEFNKYQISPDLQSPSNHASLSVCIIIKEKIIQDRKQTITKNSKKEKEFINELKNRISCINTTNILNCKMLEHTTQEFTYITKKL